MKKKNVTICPKCNSTDVSTDFSNPGLVATGLFNNAKVCNNCGYSANFFPEVEVDKVPKVKTVKKEEKRVLINNMSHKNIKLWWKISGPLGMSISLLFIFFINIEFIFYLGSLSLLPLSIMLTFNGYKKGLIQKYRFLRFLSLIIYFYAIFVAPLIIVYISS